MNQFVHLHTHSHYSLLDGLAKIPDLVKEAARLGMPALALTDHGNLYGAIEFYKEAKKAGIKPIIGCEVYIAARTLYDKVPGIDDKRSHLILLAENEEGYKNLIKLVTISNLEGFYYKPRLDKATLKKHSKGLIALSACLSGEVAKALLRNNPKEGEKIAAEYREIFGKENFFIELSHHPNIPNHAKTQEALKELARNLKIPTVASQDTHYLKPEDAEAQDVLLAVQTNTKLDDEDRLTIKEDNFSFRTPDEMAELFKDSPEAISNAVLIASRCNLNLKLGEIQFPHFEIPAGETTDTYLEKLTKAGLLTRFGKNPPQEAVGRMNYELGVFKKTGFGHYMLVVQDLVNWAKKNGIVVGPGRGSTAGCLVAYLLNVTEVNPIKYNLIFERFLNPERISPPDIDLDFADTRRDEVIEYVSQKYGKDHVAQIITFGTMAARAAVRDAGRALGFSYQFCDETAKMIPFGFSLEKALENIAELKQSYSVNPDAKRLINSAKKLEGVARHASVHACGVVITASPLTESVPLQYATSRGESGEKYRAVVTQYDMRAIEDLGLLKMDFLGLKNLSIIESAIELAGKVSGRKIDVNSIPLDDKATFKMLSEGKTIGVFQLEGGGMTRYLVELRPSRLEDIIAMVALFRPGPMELIPRYIARKNNEEPISYLHPKLKSILEPTYGVITYQEQLMQIAQEMAGFSLGEADLIRKAVGKKIKKLLDEQTEKFINGVEKTLGSKSLGEKLWKFIEPFARYGFNKAHSAGYALVAYQTAYLKTHFPLEFMTALMNADEKDIERIAFLVKECGNLGITVLPPDINTSNERFTPLRFQTNGEEFTPPSAGLSSKNGPAIRFGLRAIKNVGHNVVEEIIRVRDSDGQFISFSNFLDKISTKNLNKKSLEALIKSGALDGLGERNQMLENLQDALQYHRESGKAASQNQTSFFSLIENHESLPSLKLKKVRGADFDEKLRWEKELLGLYISGHPIEKIKNKLKDWRMTIEKTKSMRPGSPVLLAGIIESINKITTKKGDPMIFVQLMDLTGSIEIVVFPSILSDRGHLFQEDKTIVIKGRVSDRNGKIGVICNEARNFE